jgi:NAD/NADP transhydrogenase alpha subunit
VKTIWQGRVTEAAARYGEHAPMATTCCNACRTCVQTNLIAGVLAAVVAAGTGIARIVRRTSDA